MPDTTPTRRRPTPGNLGWRAIVAATVLATLAAGAVVLVLGGSDDADRDADRGSLELTPAEEVGEGDPRSVPFRWPDGDDRAADGEATLEEVLDGPTVVNFFASWCAPCVSEMPDFEAVSQELAGDVAFFGLAVRDRPEDAQRIVDRTGITYDWARDVGGDVANAAGVVQMPTTMFIDAGGEIVEIHSGALTADRLRALIDEHLGVPP